MGAPRVSAWTVVGACSCRCRSCRLGVASSAHFSSVGGNGLWLLGFSKLLDDGFQGADDLVLLNLGLGEAIENIARVTMEVNPVKISCRLKNFIEDSVNHKFKLNIFRIVQEQLNNILKHARATIVIVSLSQNKELITLTISDNGIGFDTGKKRTGIGVDNIKSRAVAYQGVAEFVSQPGQGCVLNATFPFTDILLPEN